MASDGTVDLGSDWWANNTPPASVTGSVGGGIPWAAGAQQPSAAPAGMHWDANMANFVPDAPAPAATGDAAIRAQIAQWAAMPGADPSLANDPDYWVNAINSRGGLTDANRQYWQDASVGPSAFFNNPNRESGGQPTAAPLSAIGGAPTPTSYTPPPAPQYTPYNPGPAPTPTPFVAPTAADAAATPGYQFALDQGNQGLQRSAAAKGGLLSGGALKDISSYNVGMADQNYQNVFGNALTANEANNGQALNAYTANANANISAGGLNLSGTNQQFQNTNTPAWNAYLSNVGQQQFGANYGLQANQQQFGQGLATNQFDLGAQGQYFNQGLASNENAFSQYNTSQNAAFDQWYKLYMAGNPGNPYA